MKTWIKLYTEILSDPKMGRMNDRTFRRTIELFLLAGKEDAAGLLPSVEDIAWTLHTSEKEIQTVIDDLLHLKILKVVAEGYLIVRFAERQNSDLSKSEINRRYYLNSKQRKSEIQSEFSLNSDENTSENQTLEEEVEEEVEVEEENNKDKTPAKSEKPRKHKYGEYKHVLLSDEDMRKLIERFPEDYQQRIQDLDDYLENSPSKYYANHYLTILKWARNDQKKQQTAQAPAAAKRTYSFAEVGEMMRNGELTI